MIYYPSRKAVGILGFLDLGLAVILTYQYLTSFRIAYAICDAMAIGLSIFILIPVFRNQVVEIINDSITVQTFRTKNYLTIDNLTGIRRNKDGSNSYRFAKHGNRFQITPYGYSDQGSMSQEFERIFDKPGRKGKPDGVRRSTR